MDDGATLAAKTGTVWSGLAESPAPGVPRQKLVLPLAGAIWQRVWGAELLTGAPISTAGLSAGCSAFGRCGALSASGKMSFQLSCGWSWVKS